MSIKLIKMALKGVPMPGGFHLVGWIERHPRDKSSGAYAVLRSNTGIEMAWDGGALRSLPSNWRNKVEWEDGSELTQVLTQQPKGFKATIESALQSGETLTDFVRVACAAELKRRGVDVDAPEIKMGRPAGSTDDSK